jgi:hypothetical protein
MARKWTEWNYEQGYARIEGAYFPLPPHYPVPAVLRCTWCGTDFNDVNNPCTFNGTGEWCPEICFKLN